jgi:hypothetical protein
MDIEFGTGGVGTVRRNDTEVGREINRLHFEQGEEMCREFGTGGTTLQQRRKQHGLDP